MAEETKSFITWVAPLSWFNDVTEPGKEVLFGWKIDELQDYSNVVACVVERGYYVYPDSFWKTEVYRGLPSEVFTMYSQGEYLNFYQITDTLPQFNQVPNEYIGESSIYGVCYYFKYRVKLVYHDGESDWKESSIERVYVTNSPPTSPSPLSVPSTILAGEHFTISWGEATDEDGNLEGYLLQRSDNGGAWVDVYTGAELSTQDSIDSETITVQYRVCAYDSDGDESDYVTGNIISVNHNTAPKISGTDENIGQFSTSFTQKYTVTDNEGGSLDIVESIDGIAINSFSEIFTGNISKEYTVIFTAEQWARIGNGDHALTIKATDSYGESAERNYTFTKLESEIHLQYLEPLETENPVVLGILTVDKFMAVGASFSVEVCNNALDVSPTWENVTSAVNLGGRFYLNNNSKKAEKWGFNVSVKVKRETATEDSWISEVSGYYREG